MKTGINIVLVIVLIAGPSVFAAIKILDHPGNKIKPADLAHLNEAGVSNTHIVDTAVSLLKSGDVVLRMGLGADSRLLAQFNQKNKSYSHCGIVMIENGQPRVYHSIGGEDNPDERLRRDPAKSFFSPLYNTAIAIVRYDLDGGQISELKKVVTAYYRQRPKFDMKFDLQSDDKLYCAEFVYKAINKVVNDTNYIQTTSVAGIRFVGVDNLFVNPHAHMVWQTAFR